MMRRLVGCGFANVGVSRIKNVLKNVIPAPVARRKSMYKYKQMADQILDCRLRGHLCLEVESQTNIAFPSVVHDAMWAPVAALIEPVQRVIIENCPPWYHFEEPNRLSKEN